MPTPLLPILALGAGAFFLMSGKKKSGSAKPDESDAAEEDIADDVDEAIEEAVEEPPRITPSRPPITGDTVPLAEPELVASGIAGKGSYRVMQISEAPPRFDAQILIKMGVWNSVGQFETIETAKAAAISAGIEMYGAIGD